MKKFKVFQWLDPNKGLGEGKTKFYSNANNEEEVQQKLSNMFGKYYYITFGIKEIGEFVQPQPIPMI